MQTVIPKIISDLLSNPGIGFIAAPHLMGDPAELRDNRGTPVPAKHKNMEPPGFRPVLLRRAVEGTGARTG